MGPATYLAKSEAYLPFITLDRSKQADYLGPSGHSECRRDKTIGEIEEPDAVDDLLGFIYFVGIIVSFNVYYYRAGFRSIKAEKGIDWREFILPNLPWMGLMLLKCFGWCAVLIVWALQGRPPSPWQASTMQEGREVRAVRRVSNDRSGRHRVVP
jgi:hypothetical protein